MLAWQVLPVTLYDFNGLPKATTVTDSSGNYLFSNLPHGSYIVKETITPGFVAESDTSGSLVDGSISVYLPGGKNSTNNNFVVEPLRLIAGNVLELLSPKKGGDAPLSGVKIELVDINGIVINATLTDSLGAFSYIVPPGKYTLREIVPPGFCCCE